MVPHHRLGIELLDDAVPRVDDVRLRRLIFKMSGYHGSEMHDLEKRMTGWSVAESVRFPGWISPSAVEELRELSGPDYDLRWLDLMIAHHEGAVTLADVEEAEGSDRRLRELARGIAIAQREEIDKMSQLRSAIAATEGHG
jgi:uncharacterized protein (DUF305 family)